VLRTRDLPNDVETLKRLLAEKDAALEAARGELRSHRLEIERLRLQLARLRRLQFGRSSEQLDEQIAQLELALEELEAAEAAEPVTHEPSVVQDFLVEDRPISPVGDHLM
jgi:transposase